MANSGNVYIVRGDITRCRAGAVIFSTDVGLNGDGALHSSFKSWPTFERWYSDLRQLPPKAFGETDWMPATDDRPGVVLLRAVGSQNHQAPAQQVAGLLRNALDRARAELGTASTSEARLILVPALLVGAGGGHDHRREIARNAFAAAAAWVDEVRELDVAFVLYTPADYAMYREARRTCGRAPRHPELANHPGLTSAVTAGELSVFVGAGLSMAAKMPSWDALIRQLAREAEIPHSEALPYAEKLDVAKRYRELRSPAELLAQVYRLFGASKPPTLAHYLLAQLGSRFVFTTNYDRLVEATLSAVKRPWHRVAHARDVSTTSQRGVTQVVKLHGDAAEPGELGDHDAYRDVVLGGDEYDNFAQHRTAFDLLLGASMLNQTLLFAGYSVDDDNVKRTWAHVLGAVNAYSSGGRHRQAYGLEYDRRGTPIAGVDWIPNAGTDEVSLARAQWTLLDALAEYVVEPSQVLAPETRDAAPLGDVQRHLHGVATAIVAKCSSSARFDPAETRVFARVAELLYELGWKSAEGEPSLWLQLADAAAGRPTEQHELLLVALVHAASDADAEEIRARLHAPVFKGNT